MQNPINSQVTLNTQLNELAIANEDLALKVAEQAQKAPTGSEAFTASFKAALQGFDQVRSSVHTAYANLEKSADSALNSNEHVVQTATKARKAIAAS